MEIEFLGHACVVIRCDGGTMILDPYGPSMFGGKLDYKQVDVEADWVVSTHDHLDHSALHAVPGKATPVDEGEFGPFFVARYPLAHDEYEGRRRGGLVDAVRVETGSGSLLHLSDVGESPRAEVVEANRNVDVLLVPTGGFYTIGAAQAWEWVERIHPRTAIAIHYRTPACHLPMRDQLPFEGWCESSVWNSHRIHVEETLPPRLIIPPRLV